MSQAVQDQRYTVSDIGYGFAVHDTRAPYQRLVGEERGKLPDSSSAITSRILEIFPTREAAWSYARELNQAEQRRS